AGRALDIRPRARSTQGRPDPDSHSEGPAMIDLSKLDALKDLLVRSTNFSQVLSYFFDHFGENPEFIALGERVEVPFLEAVLEQVGGEVFNRDVPVTGLVLTRLAEQRFVHGGCAVGGRLANIFYFEDVQVGLMAVILPGSPPETRLARFSGRHAPGPW